MFWFSGFFFPQAFITGTLQNYSRKMRVAIDGLDFEFIVKDQEDEQTISPVEQGVLISGIFLEGARWDSF